ncbi:MAG TPA: DUF1360 domain-containing protein [Streptosporangiaceae bacterium]|nr:DUF1360 domain-containing protein [Streptosporangiaceae bacterium]
MSASKAPSTGLAASARQVARRYSGGADLPLGGYLVTITTYGTLVTALAALARATGREGPARLSAGDVLMSAAATHKLSRLITKDPVTSPLRAPFASFEGTSGPAELADQPRGNGAEKSIGELVTCPFCAEVWVGTGITAGLVFLPRITRLVMGTFAALAGADILHYVHSWLGREAG